MRKIQLNLFYIIILLISFSPLSTVFASDTESMIKYRQQIMNSFAANLKMLKPIATGKLNFNSDIQAIANDFKLKATMLHKSFPEGSDFGDTEAKEAVWENMADFKQKIEAIEHASQALLDGSKSNLSQTELMNHFKKIGQTCKSCHKKYKEK